MNLLYATGCGVDIIAMQQSFVKSDIDTRHLRSFVRFEQELSPHTQQSIVSYHVLLVVISFQQ